MIEQLTLQFASLQIRRDPPPKKTYQLISANGPLEVSEVQYQYYDQLASGSTVQKLVKDFIQRGWLISFRELYDLLARMTAKGLILNPEMRSFFHEPVKAAVKIEYTQLGEHVVATPEHLRKLPFFRTLAPEVQDLFVRHTVVRNMPENTRFCQTGQMSRQMFAMLDGMAGVYRTFPDGRRQLLSNVSIGSLVGEGGFLLGRPRGADVITLAPSTVAVIQHSPEFSQMIDSGKAQALQRRFWVLSGLLSSEIFSQVPPETLDNLVFAGDLREVRENTSIVREGDPGRSFFIIVQGSISVLQKGKLLRSIGQGGIFGEIALMVSHGVRTATALAQRDCLLLEIGMQEFYDVLSGHLFLAQLIEEMAWQRWNTLAR